jgi:hypothetical protein
MHYTSKYYALDLKVFKKSPQVNLMRKNINSLLQQIIIGAN